MLRIRPSFVALVVASVLACRGKDNVKATTETRAKPVVSEPPSRFTITGWPEDAGPVVVLPGTRPQDVNLVLPDLIDRTMTDSSSFLLDSLPGGAVQLFSRSSVATLATISGGQTEETVRGCKSWPAARLAAPVGGSWKLGLAVNAAEPLALQGWGPGLTADSMQAGQSVVDIAARTRSDSAFHGIQFSLRYLHRIELGNARAVIADAVRRINTEANVREEHVLVIAERRDAASTYVSAFRAARVGGEDDVQVPEIIVALRIGENRRPALFVSLEYRDGSRLLLLERMSVEKWIVRWRSAYAGC